MANPAPDALAMIAGSVQLLDATESMSDALAAVVEALEAINLASGQLEQAANVNAFTANIINVLTGLAHVAKTSNEAGRALLAEQN